jgi:hypothetical protein
MAKKSGMAEQTLFGLGVREGNVRQPNSTSSSKKCVKLVEDTKFSIFLHVAFN